MESVTIIMSMAIGILVISVIALVSALVAERNKNESLRRNHIDRINRLSTLLGQSEDHIEHLTPGAHITLRCQCMSSNCTKEFTVAVRHLDAAKDKGFFIASNCSLWDAYWNSELFNATQFLAGVNYQHFTAR